MEQTQEVEGLNEFIVEERNRETKELERDVEALAEAQSELAKMVKEQGEEIDESEKHIRFTYESCYEAAESLRESEKQVDASRRRKFWVGLGVVTGVCVATLALVGSGMKGGGKVE